MKKAIINLLLLSLFPLWVLVAFSQVLTGGIYAGLYYLRILICSDDTQNRFCEPKKHFNRIFEITEKEIERNL